MRETLRDPMRIRHMLDAIQKVNDFMEGQDAEAFIPWRQIIAMRHILVHGYYQIEADELYNVYSQDLPLLLPLLERCYNSID